MANTEDNKILERKARSLIMTKNAPPATMELVRGLFTNVGISPNERHRAIIAALEKCPDKPVNEITDDFVSELNNNMQNKTVLGKSPSAINTKSGTVSDHFHTETSFYIDDLYKRYKLYKFFKIRYLARRDNRLSLGFKKRLIPSRRLLKALNELYELQETLLSRLSVITMDILNDDSIDDATCFNYLRMMRNWLSERPLLSHSYDGIKWMERANFEREFKNYLYSAFSFQRLSAEMKERLVKQVESKLILMTDLRKDEVFDADSDSVKRDKEKRNFECDKEILSFLRLLRMFLYGSNSDDNALSETLQRKYKVYDYNGFLMMITEALIYQRPAQIEDVVYKFNIKTPEVSKVKWSYSEDYLKKIGKDALAHNRKQMDYLRDKLIAYDTINTLLNVRDRGVDVVTRGVGFQWQKVNKNKYDAEEIFKSDFPTFIEGAILFFNNMFTPLINGTKIVFRDKTKKEFASSIFADEFFSDEMKSLKKLIGLFHEFRTNNPMVMVSREEAIKIMRRQIASMDHVESLLRNAGDFFYNVAKKLLPHYEGHQRWSSSSNSTVLQNVIHTPLATASRGIEAEAQKINRPLPFSDCTIVAFNRPGLLSGGLEGKKLFENNIGDGAIGFMMAFVYQVANLCNNAELFNDLDERAKILRRIDELNREIK